MNSSICVSAIHLWVGLSKLLLQRLSNDPVKQLGPVGQRSGDGRPTISHCKSIETHVCVYNL